MSIKIISNVKLGVIGCGKMASAIINAIVEKGFINNDNIAVYDIISDSALNFANKYGFKNCKNIQELLDFSNTILIATKPFCINDVLSELKKYYDNQLVLSILAGVKIEKYLSTIPNIKIIRIMPNTPALIGLGMSAVCRSLNVSDVEEQFAFDFMKNCGEVILTSEDKMDIITALSGSGPAYFYKIIELMAKSAQKLGLDYSQALLLSAQTALGSAKMVLENEFNINQLITNVTTPGGCTEAGNLALNNSEIDSILDKVIADTANKAKELG